MSERHEALLKLARRHPKDYQPFGHVERWKDPTQAYPDCSCGCKHALPLPGELAADWCVCTNPQSHRAGLLTFEHQGCQAFEAEPENDA